MTSERKVNECEWCHKVYPPYVILHNGMCAGCNDAAERLARGEGIDDTPDASQASAERESFRQPHVPHVGKSRRGGAK